MHTKDPAKVTLSSFSKVKVVKEKFKENVRITNIPMSYVRQLPERMDGYGQKGPHECNYYFPQMSKIISCKGKV